MTTKNGKVHKIEAGVPGVPEIHHIEMQRACDRFLVSRGLQDAYRWKHGWLFGSKKRRAV